MNNGMACIDDTEALAQSIAREDLGKVIDIRSRVRTALEDTIDRVTRQCREVADSSDGDVDALAADGRTLRGR